MKPTKILYIKDISANASDNMDIHDVINIKQSLRNILNEYGMRASFKVNTFYNFAKPMLLFPENDNIFGFQARTIIYNTFLKDYRE